MKIIKNITVDGERPFYCLKDATLQNVTIGEGESAVKECRNISVKDCLFKGKYPLWRTFNMTVTDCKLEESARAALWYSEDCLIENCTIGAPKAVRDVCRATFRNCTFTGAAETAWHCHDLKFENVRISGADYFLLGSHDIEIEGLDLTGPYTFQYARNITIRNSIINTKDAFWETDNVTVYDSTISGQYLAWHSRNLRLVRCHINGTQPLCYAEGLVLEDCTFGELSDLAFEYSDVRATILSPVQSIKNPRHGSITVQKAGEIIIDENLLPGSDCAITETEKNAPDNIGK